jgi:hypothetical protein
MTEQLRRRDLSLFERWASARHTLTQEVTHALLARWAAAPPTLTCRLLVRTQEYDRRRAKLLQRLERSGGGCECSPLRLRCVVRGCACERDTWRQRGLAETLSLPCYAVGRAEGCDSGPEQQQSRTLGEDAASQRTDSAEPADPWRCVPDPVRDQVSPRLS